MTVTRSKRDEIFSHILKDVMNLNRDDQLWKSLTLNGYNTISDIITMKQRKLLDHILKWRKWRSKQLDSFNEEKWLNLTVIDFENFRLTILLDIIHSGSNTH